MPGLALVVAGIGIIIGTLGSEIAEWFGLGLLVAVLGIAYGLPGAHRYQAPADGPLGKWGSLLAAFGAGVLALLGIVFLLWEALGDPPDEGPAWTELAWPVGFFALLIGVVLFAIGTIRAKVLPTLSGVLMLVGLVSAIAVDMATGAFFEDDGSTTEWGFYIGLPVFAIGLAWAGYAIWKGSEVRSEGAATTTATA
ncbi:MAG TPA: hypothetical protein VFV40_08960 [Nocardioides sp.]|nr:hypothetical protein [Nocardioides sp.]